MFGSEILDVAIGLIFIFILMSVIGAAIREVIEAKVKSRAAYLEHGIRELLHDKSGSGLASDFYKHPLIHSLFSNAYTPPAKPAQRPGLLARGGEWPSYIPAKNFARALMDMAAHGTVTDDVSSDPAMPPITIESLRTNILNLHNHAVQRVLLLAIDSARGDLDVAQKNIEEWYESAMDRVSGWYKRSTQWILFFIGLVLAVGLNVNTLAIGDYLYWNEGARAALVARAEGAAANPATVSNYDAAKKELDELRLPIGWTDGGAPRRTHERFSWWGDRVAPVLGWLLTALAVTLGAPFWFDTLNKVMVIRSTVKPHEKSKEEASEDRQVRPRDANAMVAIEPSKQMPLPMMVAPMMAAASPALPASIPAPRDAESDIDGCNVSMIDSDTADEDLPPVQGGVQS
jgi:hypothetical protein